MAKYPPIFKRIKINPEKEGTKIAQTQDAFEAFWRDLSRKCPPNSEKTMAMRKMQEACMWLTRGIALSGFKSEDKEVNTRHESGFKGDLSDKLKSVYTKVEVKEKSPSTEIIVKKKKEYVKEE